MSPFSVRPHTRIDLDRIKGRKDRADETGHWSGLYNTPALVTFAQGVAVAKTSQGWGQCLLRGIGCNFLVCMAVLLGTGAREIVSKIAALHFPVMLFVFLGFEHVIV